MTIHYKNTNCPCDLDILYFFTPNWGFYIVTRRVEVIYPALLRLSIVFHHRVPVREQLRNWGDFNPWHFRLDKRRIRTPRSESKSSIFWKSVPFCTMIESVQDRREKQWYIFNIYVCLFCPDRTETWDFWIQGKLLLSLIAITLWFPILHSLI